MKLQGSCTGLRMYNITTPEGITKEVGLLSLVFYNAPRLQTLARINAKCCSMAAAVLREFVVAEPERCGWSKVCPASLLEIWNSKINP